MMEAAGAALVLAFVWSPAFWFIVSMLADSERTVGGKTVKLVKRQHWYRTWEPAVLDRKALRRRASRPCWLWRWLR